MFLNAAKLQGYSFYRFLVIRENHQGGNNPPNPPPPTQIRVNRYFFKEDIFPSPSNFSERFWFF